MSRWSHRLCERCFYDSEFGTIAGGENDGAYRQPVQIIEIEREPAACCMCGGFVALTGIYVRKDPDDLLCEGRHDPDEWASWSQVGFLRQEST